MKRMHHHRLPPPQSWLIRNGKQTYFNLLTSSTFLFFLFKSRSEGRHDTISVLKGWLAIKWRSLSFSSFRNGPRSEILPCNFIFQLGKKGVSYPFNETPDYNSLSNVLSLCSTECICIDWMHAIRWHFDTDWSDQWHGELESVFCIVFKRCSIRKSNSSRRWSWFLSCL